MSWSLRLRNGDFAVENARLGMARGHEKLIQDFRCAILTRMGADLLHPTWGSLIDGGTTPDGREVPGVVGDHDPAIVAIIIETEIRRIAQYLQERQLARVKHERLRYSKVTLTASEILVGVSDVNMVQIGDTIEVLVRLTTGAGTNLDVSLPLDSLVGR